MNTRRKPDLEAVTVKVRADKITDRGYFHARKTHGGNRMAAEGGVEVTVVKQHKGSGKSNKRPAPGTVFSGPEGEEPVEIEARGIIVHKNRDKEGKQTGNANGRVEIFGKLRRRRRWLGRRSR